MKLMMCSREFIEWNRNCIISIYLIYIVKFLIFKIEPLKKIKHELLLIKYFYLLCCLFYVNYAVK